MTLADVDRDRPIRLSEAAAEYRISVKTLRREADRGRLTIWRAAGKLWTTYDELDRMMRACPVPPKVPACGSGQQDATRAVDCSNPPASSSEMEDGKLALAAAKATVRKLKDGSRNTSQANTRQRAANVISAKFGSRT